MVLTLYKLDASPPVRGVYMTLDILGLDDVEMIDVNLFAKDHLKDEYLKMNPQHTIPTLKDGDFVIWDSHAISTYLINNYARNHSLYPTDPKIRALIDQKLHFNGSILFPALRGTVEPILFMGETEFAQANLNKIDAAYGFMEKFLTDSWLVGKALTIADICCVATISTMDTVLPIDKNKYPKLTAWLQRLAVKDFYKKVNQPGLDMFKQLVHSKLA